ncbi:MAG: HPr-rel-A system PqqD family peptide chaperone [Sphingomonadaceae bacterium]|nr:HPr-rel-A system PqqD family peptide chaperone [Sphingomonadaceae bacterium]
MANPTYRADPPEARRLVTLDDGVTLVFHRPSGLTHVLAPPAPELLAALGEGDADIAILIERLRAAYDLAEDDLEAALAARLAELETAGLVWRR